MRKAITHVLERTSPKGGPFLGYCILCGKQGLTMDAALEPCDNPRGLSTADAIIEAIEGPPEIEGPLKGADDGSSQDDRGRSSSGSTPDAVNSIPEGFMIATDEHAGYGLNDIWPGDLIRKNKETPRGRHGRRRSG